MSKELTKEEAEEFYNKLWLENKELIQENIDKINTEIFELELELVDKDKEIERLNNIIEKIRDYVYKPIDKEWDDILCIIEDGLKQELLEMLDKEDK